MIDVMNDVNFILLILGTMVVTYIPRMLPLVVLSKSTLPKRVEQFLDNIPVAILGSILFSSIFIRDDVLDISFSNEYLVVGLLTIIIARYVRRLDVVVLSGIVLTIIYRLLF